MSRQHWIRVSFDEQYWKELEAYYSLAWYKRLFKRPPTPPKTRSEEIK